MEVDRGARERILRLVEQWRRQLALGAAPPVPDDRAGLLLALAYPDRVGLARGGQRRYLLSGGRGAFLADPQALARQELIVAAELDAGEREARIFVAAPVSREDLELALPHRIATRDVLEWDAREQAVVARRERRLGAVVLESGALRDADPEKLAAAMLTGIRSLGLEALPWTREARALQTRAEFARRHASPQDALPAMSDEALAATLDEWLLPWLDRVTRRDHLSRLDLLAILRARLGHAARQRVDALAPTHLTVPSGSRIPIDYSDPQAPSVAVRLQEMFGLLDTPRVGGGRVPLTVEMLSPAGRPVQVTRDLRSFWERGYAEVKKELKGRYPKHYWPDDPLTATPTHRVRPRP
jgi:ATP-dependent helicase HrpB